MSSLTVRSRLASIIEQLDTCQRRKLVLPFRSQIVSPGTTRELAAYPQHMFAARHLAITVSAPAAAERPEPLLESDINQVFVDDLRTGTQSDFSTVGGVPIRSFGNKDLHLPASSAGLQHTLVVTNRGSVPVVVYATMFGDAIRSSGTQRIRESLHQLYEEVPSDTECLKPKAGDGNDRATAAMVEHLRRIMYPQVSSDAGPTTSWIAFSEARLAPFKEATMEVVPQEEVQIAELDFSASLPREAGGLIAPDDLDRLLVQDILVGGVSQFVGSGAVPISHFKGQKLGFDRVVFGQTVALRVLNVGPGEVQLSAVARAGREVAF
jgi:hypothetical protein